MQQPCGTSITRPTKEKTGPYVSRYPWDGSNACCIPRVWQCVATKPPGSDYEVITLQSLSRRPVSQQVRSKAAVLSDVRMGPCEVQQGHGWHCARVRSCRHCRRRSRESRHSRRHSLRSCHSLRCGIQEEKKQGHQ